MGQIDALFAHWQREPPVSLLVAAFIGYKPHEQPSPAAKPRASANGSHGQTNTRDWLEAMIRQSPQGGVLRAG